IETLRLARSILRVGVNSTFGPREALENYSCPNPLTSSGPQCKCRHSRSPVGSLVNLSLPLEAGESGRMESYARCSSLSAVCRCPVAVIAPKYFSALLRHSAMRDESANSHPIQSWYV